MLEVIMTLVRESIARDASPRNEERDEQIARPRNEDKRHWSWGQLARRFKIKPDTARKAYNRQIAEMESFRDTVAFVRQFTAAPGVPLLEARANAVLARSGLPPLSPAS
jgi:hypothetical protein